MNSEIYALASSDGDAYIIEVLALTIVPGHQSTAKPTAVNNGEVLVPRNVLTCTQTTLDQVLQDMQNISPILESKVIVALQQLVKGSGFLPARYTLDGVTISDTREVVSGGFADIYRGNVRGQLVCVKVIRPAGNTQDDVRKGFMDEAILCGSLSHPNIVPLLGVYFKGTTQWLVYPWMKNGDLVLYLKRYPLSSRAQLLHDVTLGLRYLHERSIIHGDLKGVNVLVDDSGKALIADFGLASISPSSGGTLMYKAPEILDPEAYNTKESDVYAFGCLAYEVFAGKPPFGNLTAHLIVRKVMHGHRPKRPSDSSPSWNAWGLTEDIWALIERCWKADPATRPTIDVVMQFLEQAFSGDV
ncbi:hypothetical protein H0H92_006368 [Tricholoma furcatifolium]|nr:hypothetical protein H0H92_006368 [Tricholoma furcatifolium]